MAGSEWSREELEAAVRAYLQMLDMELTGQAYNKAEISRALKAGPLSGRSSTDHRMQNISSVLLEMGRPTIPGFKPLSNVGGRIKGQLKEIIQEIVGDQSRSTEFEPSKAKADKRKFPPTGYWMFVANRTKWDGIAWLKLGDETLLYNVAKAHVNEMRPGDLGVIRINANRNSDAGVIAIVSVEGSPVSQADPDSRAYSKVTDAAATKWRVPIRILANLVDEQIPAGALPDTPDFDQFRNALQMSTIPISPGAFSFVVGMTTNPQEIQLRAQVATSQGVKDLETTMQNATPKQQERVSKYIERGPIGQKVKDKLGGACQICSSLNSHPIAFLKSNGTPYAEAHHVIPVAALKTGTLSATNIMVLCPNHHRQMHYGQVEIADETEQAWTLAIDGQHLKIQKTTI